MIYFILSTFLALATFGMSFGKTTWTSITTKVLGLSTVASILFLMLLIVGDISTLANMIAARVI